MPRTRRRRDAVVIAVSVALHVVLAAIVAVQAPELFIPPDGAEPAQTILRVTLIPRPPAPASAARPNPLRLHRQAPHQIPAPFAPLPAAPQAATAPARPGPAAVHPAPLPEGPKGEIRAALRTGSVGCANREAVSLNRAERGDCDERLGRGAGTARFIPAPLDPGLRAYYDAVAKAKAPDGPPTPQSARGRAGMFEDVAVGMKGRPPAVICHLSFGAGRARLDRPAHGLRLGPLPCFVAPPVGSLSPDADVQNPDQVLRHSPDR